ncbi:unnamed protein product, partial [Discosporangium mesarthrocarpum]
FSAGTDISTTAKGAYSVFAADIDGDTDLDVLSASADDNCVTWYENTDGLGSFSGGAHISKSSIGASSAFAADIDGDNDGDLDVLSASYWDDRVVWYENTDGLGSFSMGTDISTTADGSHSVFAADIDGDGDLDVLSASAKNDRVVWYENTDGLGSFSIGPNISTTADYAESVFAADI